MALPGLPWSLSVCYDFAIGVVTNIIAAAILDSKAPSLLDDFDKDEAGNKNGKDSFLLAVLLQGKQSSWNHHLPSVTLLTLLTF